MTAELPIVQYWHAADPPPEIVELTQSFARLNPQRPHLLFDEQSAETLIAEQLGERELAAFRACGPPAMQADYFRCCAILALGGIWADAGYACVRNLNRLLERSRGGELFRAFVSNRLVMNGLFAFVAPRHPFLRLAVELSTGLIEMRWRGKVNEITGPLVMTAIHGLGHAGSVEAFLDEVREVAPEDRRPHFTRYAEAVCELVGDQSRAREACVDLRISPAASSRDWVQTRGELSHRDSADHWSSLGSSVYRSAAPPAKDSASPGHPTARVNATELFEQIRDYRPESGVPDPLSEIGHARLYELLGSRQLYELWWSRAFDSGQWERRTRALIERVLRPGDLFLDIGAWIGPVTTWALGQGAQVIAVEPDPIALAELKRRVADRVEIWEGAVAPRRGSAGLAAPGGRIGMSASRLVPAGEMQVQAWTLHEILGDRKPKLVKIDIEGYEIELLPQVAPYLAKIGATIQVALHGELPDPAWFADYSNVNIPEDPRGTVVAGP